METQADDPLETVKKRFEWKAKYTMVLVLNAGYIVLFYYLMKSFIY